MCLTKRCRGGHIISEEAAGGVISEVPWKGVGKVHFSNCYIYVHIAIKLAGVKQSSVWPSVYSHHSWMSCVLGNKQHKEGSWLREFGSMLLPIESCPPLHLLPLEPNLHIITIIFQ